MRKFIYKAIIILTAFLFVNCSSVKPASSVSGSTESPAVKTSSISEKKPKKAKKIKIMLSAVCLRNTTMS